MCGNMCWAERVPTSQTAALTHFRLAPKTRQPRSSLLCKSAWIRALRADLVSRRWTAERREHG